MGILSFGREFRERIFVCTSGETDFDLSCKAPEYLNTNLGQFLFKVILAFTNHCTLDLGKSAPVCAHPTSLKYRQHTGAG